MLKLKYFIGAGLCCGAFVLFSAFGGEKMTLVEQMKKVDAAVAENVANFESAKREECKAMALQKAIGLAEVKLASEPKAAPGKPAVTAKKATPAAPKKAPKVTPKAAPTNSKADKMNGGGNGGAVSPAATQAKKDKMNGGGDADRGAVSPEATQAKKNKMNGGGQ